MIQTAFLRYFLKQT